MKLILFVEGETERKALPSFFKRWLDPRLSKPVGISSVTFDGSGDYLRSFARRARKFLQSSQCFSVVGLLDLYGAGLPYPAATTAAQKYEWAKRELEGNVGDPRFRQHFAVHETEAWLLSDPGLLPAEVSERLPASVRTPEAIDLQRPPSKLLQSLYRQALKAEYRKTTKGFRLFSQLDPQLACDRCPHLRRLLDEMLKLSKAAGF